MSPYVSCFVPAIVPSCTASLIFAFLPAIGSYKPYAANLRRVSKGEDALALYGLQRKLVLRDATSRWLRVNTPATSGWLDSMAWNRRVRPELAEDDWERLLEVGRQADPDPWRNRIRDAIRGYEPKELGALPEETPDVFLDQEMEIDVENVSFWEALAEVMEQGNLVVDAYGGQRGQLRLSPTQAARIKAANPEIELPAIYSLSGKYCDPCLRALPAISFLMMSYTTPKPCSRFWRSTRSPKFYLHRPCWKLSSIRLTPIKFNQI